MVGVPAAVAVVVVEYGLPALRAFLHDAGTHVAALLGLLVSGDVVVELCIHDERPVDGVQVAKLGVLLNTHGASRDVPKVVQADVLEAGHLKDDQGVVVEEGSTPDDGQVGEQSAEAVQARHSEEQQVVRDHGQFGKAEGAKDLLVEGVVVLVADEQDLQVALHHGAVLQATEFADVIANVDARSTD